MAEPGSWFPQNFALSVLSLKQKADEFDAQLAHSREQEAARNFQFKQQFALQSAQFAGQEKERDLRHQEFMVGVAERAKLEADRIKREQEASIQHGFDSLGREGTGFIPLSAADKIGPALDALAKAQGAASSGATYAPATYHQIPLPGHGVLIQRIDDPKRQLELAKINADLRDHKENAALRDAQTRLQEEKILSEKQKRSSLSGGIPIRIGEAASKALADAQKQARAIQYAALQSNDKARAAEIETDWRAAFGDPKERAQIDNWQTISQAFTADIIKGIKPPERVNPDKINQANVTDAVNKLQEQNFPGTAAPPPARETVTSGRFSQGPVIQQLAPNQGDTSKPSHFRVIVAHPTSGELETVEVPGLTATTPGSRLSPALYPRFTKEAAQILNEAVTGKRGYNDPEVLDAEALLDQLKTRASEAP
jgi:hypothetical protein